MLRTTCLRSWSLASFLSLPSSFSSSLQKTTKLPILQPLFLAQQLSSFLMSLVRVALGWRAKTIATGALPLAQYRQAFSPACLPLTLSGWNGPASVSPACGPDLTADFFSAQAGP